MIDPLWILRTLKGAILGVGVIILYLALKNYRREHNRAMVFLGLGFGFITVGAVLAGVFFEVLKADLLISDIAEASMTVIGFAFILYSIFGRRL